MMESNEPVDLFLLPGTSASINHHSYLQLPIKNCCTNFSFGTCFLCEVYDNARPRDEQGGFLKMTMLQAC